MDLTNGNEDLLKVFSDVKEYEDFFQRPELFERIHLHLLGVRVKKGADKNSHLGQPGFFSDGTIKSHVISKTIGDQTGSTDFFEIGTHEFIVGRHGIIFKIIISFLIISFIVIFIHETEIPQ